MATWRKVGYDILTDLKLRFDDASITLSHVVYWVGIYANRLLILHQKKRDSGAYLSEFQIPHSLIHYDGAGRPYFDLPQAIYDYDNDGGIDYISYYANGFKRVTFSRTSRSIARRLYFTDEETPAPDNPYFYRIGSRVYILGLECITIPDLDIGLRTTLEDVAPCDLDEEMKFPGELLPVLQRQVLDLGRWVLMMPKDRTNTGDDLDMELEIPKQKVVTPDDQQQMQQMIQQQNQ